ncbi:MAG: single-stranded-DNA-specific exonuclease RecJ [Planctomycetaceae bacterium]|nr:single-stranded-DNA-specific exonuclease RecJ [Planctomycetaceae bacterium]
MAGLTQRIWRIAPHDVADVGDLCRALRVSPLVAQVLLARDCRTPAAATAFLAKKLGDLHDPELLPGVPAAADRIVAAVKDGRRITIYGDYDVDGVTATSLLWHCLQLAGAKVDYYIPSRLDEGYGLNCDALRQLHADDPQRLVVSVDCGITSVKEAALSRELGLELIISDHHQFADEFPADVILVHPRLPGDYPFGDLCGVGVAFKIAWAVCARLGDGKRASPRMREFLLSAIGLAAIGTIADVVPLTGENRVLVHYGLGSLLERSPPGLKALMQISGLLEKGDLQAEDIGFALGPRINAAGRLGQARLAVELLTTEQGDRALVLANYLDELNKNRQTVERKMLKQAKELVEAEPTWEAEGVLVLAHPEWHAGVIGIVAARVADHFRKPAILIALDDRLGAAQGSGRSFGGFNLHAGLSACRDLLTSYGGHHAAAGLKIAPDRIDDFRRQLVQVVQEAQADDTQLHELKIDAEVRLADVTRHAVLELETLGPFGAANRRPVFAATRVELVGAPKRMGEGERHLSLTVRQHGTTLRGVAFGKGDWADELAQAGSTISICFQPTINRFRGQEKVEFQLLDWQAEPSSKCNPIEK